MTKRSALSMAILLGLAAAMPVAAQNTSAAVSGRIVDEAGAPVANATVEIVHAPTGARKSVTTDADGRYVSRGLRVGGPYSVSVNKSGLEAAKKEDVYLVLAEVSTVNLTMDDGATDLETVEVVASASNTIFSADNTGTGSNFNREQIENAPTISRNIQDIARLDPRIVQIDKDRGGSISAGGQNRRYNAINIDGVPSNDEFGLNDSGSPSLNNAISMDTIDEFNISISSYDVTKSDFVGASIDAVTKSGTNEFHGTVYGLYRDGSWFGDITPVAPQQTVGRDAPTQGETKFTSYEQDITYGLTFGGPIIQDTLFFFVAYEEFERGSPSSNVGPIGSGATVIVDVTQDELNQIETIAGGYGMEAGSTGGANADNTDQKVLAKLDWNISDAHRASFRYNKTEGEQLNAGRLSANDYSFSSYWYYNAATFESYVGHLYSDWTDNLSTEFSVSYSEYDGSPIVTSRAPQVAIRVASGDQVTLGTEQFRQANFLTPETTTAYLAADYYAGDHTIKFGADWKRNDIYNLFGRDAYGLYTFNSIADFAAGNFATYSVRLPSNGILESRAADWTLDNLGLFLQDTWAYSYNLSVNYGLRVDVPNTGDRPQFNQSVFNTFGLRNDGTIDGNSVVQPRVGFNYTFDSERPTQVRGGFGLFQGSTPGVWLSNSFQNDGLNFFEVSLRNQGGFTADPDHPLCPAPCNPSTGRQVVDILSPDFQQPTVWKGNLALDHELPWWGLVASAEVLFTEVESAIYYEHLNMGPARGMLPDGRYHYWRDTNANTFTNPTTRAQITNLGSVQRFGANPAFGDVVLLDNTTKGSGRQAVVSLEKPLEDHWYAKLAYTYTEATEVQTGTSSQAETNFRTNPIFNINEEVAGKAAYAIKDRFSAYLSYKNDFFGDLDTTFGMFFESRSGLPFSYTFAGDANGDGRSTNNDLFYVPTGPGDVVFTDVGTGTSAITAAQQEAAFWAYVEGNDYLNSHRGQVVERFGANMPWVNQVDVHIAQELPGFFGDNKSEIFLDIVNFGNLLNKDWGMVEEVGFPGFMQVARMAGVDANGRYIYQFTRVPTMRTRDEVGQSRWSVQVGFRYEF